MAQRRLVVVGASLAGLRAVEAARTAGFDGRIVLVGAEEHLPYDRPPLSKTFLGRGGVRPLPTFRERRDLVDGLGVELMLGTPATGLDTAGRTVTVGDAPLGYDALVIATGARARRPGGVDRLDGVHCLRTADDARALRASLDDARSGVAVIGGGFIGSEVASAARARGLPVTVLEARPAPLIRALGAEMGALCARLHARHGTTVRCGVTVTGVEGDGRVERVLLADGGVVPADVVVIGVGADPVTGWLEGSGLELSDGVVCDETLATDSPGVYAAGDVARWHNRALMRRMRLEHWTSAAEQGAVAARNAVAVAPPETYETVPYFWSDWYGTRLQFVGLPEAEKTEVFGDPSDGRCVALYRDEDRLVGALVVNRRALTMRLRALIRRRATWHEAVTLVADSAAPAASSVVDRSLTGSGRAVPLDDHDTSRTMRRK
ncbi:NAD(P)/FAD-dependent oxidoreductase [Streptomyces sp. NPDC059063]|uniref:NAD(P)/FAD-dependent oxidoreductase n=1 Tax=unclassified Streptomyces TaxID=2593676 RepID=UPI0036935286